MRMEHVVEELRFVLALNEPAPDERAPQKRRRCIDVRPAIHRRARDLLRRHVRELPFELAIVGALEAPRRLRDAEVEHTRDAVHSDGVQAVAGVGATARNNTIIFETSCGTSPWFVVNPSVNTGTYTVDRLLVSGGGYSFRQQVTGSVTGLRAFDGINGMQGIVVA